MSRVRIPLGKSFGKGRSDAAGSQSIVNLYAQEIKHETRTDVVLYGTPGKNLFSTIGGDPRGQANVSSAHYAVMGTQLYAIDSAGTANAIGEIEGTQLVDMSYNGNQLDIVADEKSYSFDVPSLTLSEIADPAFSQASSCASIASYSLYAMKGSGIFRWRLTNSTSFSGLDFATAEAEPDALIAIRKQGGQIALLGTESTEWWVPTGDSGANAFVRSTAAAAVGIGCLSRDSAILVDGGLTWVGRDGKAGGVSVYRAQGPEPKKISDPNVDAYLEAANNAGVVSTLRAHVYQQNGHLFYCLTNPGEISLIWDVLTNQWSFRKSGSWSMGSEPMGGWDAVTFALNGSKQVVGASDGNLHELLSEGTTDDGALIVREVRTPMLYHEGKRARMTMLELDVETGLGDPDVYMTHSDDNGHTFVSPRPASVGQIGEYKYRCLWPVVGSYFNRTIIFRGTGIRAFLGAHANITVGTH